MKNEQKTLADKKDYNDNEVDWYFHKIVNNLTWILINYDASANKVRDFYVGDSKRTKDERIKACINYFENAKKYKIYNELSEFSLAFLFRLKVAEPINLEETFDKIDNLVSDVCLKNECRQRGIKI